MSTRDIIRHLPGSWRMCLSQVRRYPSLPSPIPHALLFKSTYTYPLSRDLVSPAIAKDLIFTSRRFNGEEAKALGVVNEAVTDVLHEAQVSKCVRRSVSQRNHHHACERSVLVAFNLSPFPYTYIYHPILGRGKADS